MSNPGEAATIAENWKRVTDEVARAAVAAGRDPSEIQIIGVSKYVDAETTAALADAGCRQLGENRPQQLWDKAESPSLAGRVRWHLIGHLQTNKVRRTLRYRPLIHSVDSERLLRAIDHEAVAGGFVADVLIEANVSGDAAKTGLAASAVEELLEKCLAWRAERDASSAGERVPPAGESTSPGGVNLRGLMAMAGWGTAGDDARRQFARTRGLRDRLRSTLGVELPELSMGMSGDFAEAIAEGATMVRIGSRLFDGVPRTGRHG